MQPAAPRRGRAGELRQALELRAGGREQSGTAYCTFTSRRSRRSSDLQRLQRSALYRDCNFGEALGASPCSGDRTTR